MNTALYPGSFDPITNGHVDIIERAMALYDHVIVAVLNNSEKSAVFSAPERVKLLRQTFASDNRVSVESFSGLLVDFAQSKQVNVVLRGLRAASDFEYEFQLAAMNRRLAPAIDTVFLMTGKDTFFLSSRLVKEVAFLGGDITSMVPAHVAVALKNKCGSIR